MVTHAIIVDQVSKRFGRATRAVDALRDVSLAVAPGEIYGLLGRNGAGKTTLVKIVLDIVRANSGRVAVLGRSTREATARRPIGYLPEDHRFPDYQTAAGAIEFYGALSGVPRRTLRRRTGELLDLVRLGNVARQKVRSFSKGMKQRLGLAQALVHDPEVLFLDEPTDGVDPVGRAEIRDVLARLKHENKTIFLNSHLLSEVEQLCDRVGILEQGSLVREGSIEELTRIGTIFDVRLDSEPSAETIAALEPLAVEVQTPAPGRLELALEDETAIDPVVDKLRAMGHGIRHLSGKRLSLEQVFLAAVGQGAAPRIPDVPPAREGDR